MSGVTASSAMIENIEYQVVKTKNGQVGYCHAGQGRPLILIVGYSGTLYHWNKLFVSELAKYFGVYLVDNRLIGLSTSTNEYSMRGMAEDIVDFIRAKELVQPLLFGWSMGGVITQTIIKAYPDLVAGVALLATVPHPRYTNLEFLNLVANTQQLGANEFRQQLYGMFFSEAPRAELKDLITSAALNIENYHYRFNFDAKELQDYAVVAWPGMDELDLAQITVPVLILRARNDLVVAEAASEVLAATIPQAKLIVYPAGGHFFLHRSPLMVAHDVVNFFTHWGI